MISKQRVVIFPIPSLHTDVGWAHFVMQEIKRLRDLNIPIVFADEEAADRSAEEKLAENREVGGQCKRIIQQCGLEQLIQKGNKGKGRRYFPSGSEDAVKKKLRDKYPEKSPEIINAWTTAIIISCFHEQNFQLLEFLIRERIPYQGIEYSQKQSREFDTQRFENDENAVLIAHEQNRCSNMMRNIFERAIPKLKGQDGMILVHVGAAHMLRICGMMRLKYKNTKQLRDQFDLSIFPCQLFTPYGFDGIVNLKRTEALFASTDPKELQNELKLLYQGMFMVEEDPRTGQFYSAEFRYYLDTAIRFTKQPIERFTIPDFNAAKQEKIASLDGKVINTNDEKGECKEALVELNSSLLIAEHRQLLGIERVRIIFDPETVTAKVNTLRKDKSITLEATDQPTIFLVTYPAEKAKWVQQIANPVKNRPATAADSRMFKRAAPPAPRDNRCSQAMHQLGCTIL